MIKKVLIATSLVLSFSSSALALEFSSGNGICDPSDFFGSEICEGAYVGNDTNLIGSDIEVFGETDWGLLEKIDVVEGQYTYDGGQYINFDFTIPYTNGSWSATQDLLNLAEDESIDIFFALKGSNEFSVYLWDKTTTSGDFLTNGLLTDGGSTPDLSHFSVYIRPSADYLVPTPGNFLIPLGLLLGKRHV